MRPQPMSWSEPRQDPSNPLAHPDLVFALQRQIAAGFPPGLALDLVLNELVVRAAGATRARSAALALKRGDEMVCRAATGEHAPDLGIPLNTSDGLSGACLRTHQSQLCLDTETDPRVDAVTSRRLGIRSMLIVPVLEGDELVGVLEVFATAPAEFVDTDQNLLEIFARDAARIRSAALELERGPQVIPAAVNLQPFERFSQPATVSKRAPYEIWTVVLGGLAILLAVGISFIIGTRVGWLGRSSARGHNPAPNNSGSTNTSHQDPIAQPAGGGTSAKSSPLSNRDGLVVYEQGKVVFRMKPSISRKAAAATAGEAAPAEIALVWLAPEMAEGRLRERSEPQYPAEARAAHRTGDVVLEVVVGADGSVASTRIVSGDTLLSTAASDAVRTWHYQPYRVQGRPAEFQTEVTLKFSLPE